MHTEYSQVRLGVAFLGAFWALPCLHWRLPRNAHYSTQHLRLFNTPAIQRSCTEHICPKPCPCTCRLHSVSTTAGFFAPRSLNRSPRIFLCRKIAVFRLLHVSHAADLQGSCSSTNTCSLQPFSTFRSVRSRQYGSLPCQLGWTFRLPGACAPLA